MHQLLHGLILSRFICIMESVSVVNTKLNYKTYNIAHRRLLRKVVAKQIKNEIQCCGLNLDVTCKGRVAPDHWVKFVCIQFMLSGQPLKIQVTQIGLMNKQYNLCPFAKILLT